MPLTVASIRTQESLGGAHVETIKTGCFARCIEVLNTCCPSITPTRLPGNDVSGRLKPANGEGGSTVFNAPYRKRREQKKLAGRGMRTLNKRLHAPPTHRSMQAYRQGLITGDDIP